MKNKTFVSKTKFLDFTTEEIMLMTILSVVIGIVFWAWTFVYDLAKPIFSLLGLRYALAGFWMIGGILPAFIIRKPGVALISELIAAIIEGFITRWGITAGIWGLVQGLGAELIFMLFRYKRWKIIHLIVASVCASVFSYILDYFYTPYTSLSLEINIVQLSVFMISSVLFSGVLTYILGKTLVSTKLLNQYPIAQQFKHNE